MSIAINPLQQPTGPVHSPDDGFGALSTSRGNLPLEALDVRLATTGLTVRTELTQAFRNPYAEPLEATFIFPLPDRAALTSMRMEADGRVVDAVLREREQARTDYDQAISEGRRASIAEEERPGVFTMRVGNILPGERVAVVLTLAGQLGYEDGAATLRFPLVVAPRYIPGQPLAEESVGSGVVPDTDATPDASRITPPVLLPGCPSPIDLSIEADIDPAGLRIADAESSLHPISVEELGGQRLRVRVHPGERADRDFILRLRLGDDDAISSSLVVVPDADRPTTSASSGQAATDHASVSGDTDNSGDGTFALTLLPPALTASPTTRDVVFVLDRSGSMSGWKMVTARRATARMLDTLTHADRFAVLAFDHSIDSPESLSDALTPATDRNRFRAVEFLGGLEARGGTEMLAPLLRGTDLLSAAEAPARTTPGEPGGADKPSSPHSETGMETRRELILVLVTDGQVGNEDQILAALAPKLAGVRIHAVGIDVAANDAFLRRITALAGGHCELVESEDRLDAAMEAIHRRVGAPLVTDLAVEGTGLDILRGSLTPVPLPGLYSGAALQLTGRYRGDAHGAITVTGHASGAQPWSEELSSVRSDNAGLTGAWARSRLRDLEDRYVVGASHARDHDTKALEEQIIATSLRFGVLCRFTAYVAVDSHVVNEGGAVRRVTQPVELPQGWELPHLAPPRPAIPARAMSAATGRRAAFASGAHQDHAIGVAPAGPSAALGETSAMHTGMPKLWQGPPSDVALDVSSPPAELTSEQFEQLGLVHSSLSDELSRLESVATADRISVLTYLGDRLTSILETAEGLGDLDGLRPLRELAADLRAFGQLVDPSPVEADRLWLRALDVLGAWTTGGPYLYAPPTSPVDPTSPWHTQARSSMPDSGLTQSRGRSTFWRRGR